MSDLFIGNETESAARMKKIEALAQRLYAAYRQRANYRLRKFYSQSLPEWEYLGLEAQADWTEVALEAMHALKPERKS